MKILATPFSDVKLFLYEKQYDRRGSFSEFMHENSDFHVRQINESFSKKGTFRGVHLQYSPPLSKMVRVITGEVIFVVLDVKPTSSHLGKAILIEAAPDVKDRFTTWIKVPFGYANGFLALEDSVVEYIFDEEYNASSNISINIDDPDINFSLSNRSSFERFDYFRCTNNLIRSEKDKEGFKLQDLLGRTDRYIEGDSI
jgi:dTDP-4-dehydrorhamnose 3,5-epimerase